MNAGRAPCRWDPPHWGALPTPHMHGVRSATPAPPGVALNSVSCAPFLPPCLPAAKAYLDRIKAGEDAEAGEAESDREGEEGGRDAVAERLRQDALESLGHFQRQLAHRLELPPLPTVAEYQPSPDARFLRGHRLAVTAVALTPDDRTCYSVSKDGSILQCDIETGKRTRLLRTSDESLGGQQQQQPGGGGGGRAEWVKSGPRRVSTSALLAAAVSSDGRYLALGGGDARVHIWDLRSAGAGSSGGGGPQYVRGFPGHKDAVTGLAFREGKQQLFSASLDRSVKIWSVEDLAYVDTLFGHQAEVLGVDAARAERAVTAGGDRTCRVWKVPEESQLIFRGHCNTIECCRYLSGSEWVTGSADGSLELWSATKKKAVHWVPCAHFDPGTDPQAARGAGSVGGDAATWVGSVAVCNGSDLVVSGAAGWGL